MKLIFLKKALFLFGYILFLSCNPVTSQKVDSINFVVQPYIEINKSTKMYIYFTAKPDAGSLKIINTPKSLYLEDNENTIEQLIEKKGDYYVYEGVFEAKKLGKQEFPILEMKVNGRNYKSSSFSIEVKQSTIIDATSIINEFESNNTSYSLNDTITLQLNQYSKFSNINRITPKTLVEKGAPERLFEIIDVGDVDYKVGILGFKEYIDKNFNVVEFKWNPEDLDKTIVEKSNVNYLKNWIFRIKLIAKKKGSFSINNSNFDYEIRKDEEQFKQDLLNDRLENTPVVNVKSNKLIFTVL